MQTNDPALFGAPNPPALLTIICRSMRIEFNGAGVNILNILAISLMVHRSEAAISQLIYRHSAAGRGKC
jgi:hypothetical protein